VHDLTTGQRAFLDHFGFDEALHERWQRQVASGELSPAKNAVDAPLTAPPADALDTLPEAGSRAFDELERLGNEAIRNGQLGMVVLNGGMATRFGGVVKGVVPVLDERRTFLALCLEDALRAGRAAGGTVPVFLMNSFATDAATKQHFVAHGDFGAAPGQVEHFTQFIALRLNKDGTLFRGNDGEPSYYGPGHGDFTGAFKKSGCLGRFLAQGGRHVLVRNVDNLGARIEPAILGLHLRRGRQATVELAPKKPGDVGGAPYLLRGRTQLVEGLRFPKGFDPDVVDVFNTNTLWFDARAIDRDFELGRYYVEKKVDGRPAVQVEHLIGELTAHLTTTFLRVSRSGCYTRFLPVKTPEDLQQLRSEIQTLYD
jgi:UTP--glucose-1-phosphate uridylyltransferase